MSPWVAASACHPSAVTDRADTGDGAGRGFVPGFVPGAPRIALPLGMSDPSRSAFPPCPQGCSCSSWEELSPSSHRDHFSLSENPAGAAQGSALQPLCLFGMFLAQIIHIHPVLSRHSSAECPREHFPFTELSQREKAHPSCRWVQVVNGKQPQAWEII